MKKRILSLTLCLTLILGTSSIFANGLDTEYIESMANFIKQNYLYEIEDKKLMEGAIKGLFSTLDPYSQYYTAEEYKLLTETLTGELDQAGIGVKITHVEGVVTITDVMKSNPAQKSGLKPEDIILSINQADIKEMTIEEITNLIRGKAGTTVKLGVKRLGSEKTLYYNVVREPIIINPVEYREIEGGIGYVKINEFNNNSLISVKTALHQFDAKGVKKVIFDVRDNPGGYLSSVCDMLRILVPKGPLYHTRDSKGVITTAHSYNTMNSPKYNIAVLTNENSASAAEIFAGAIQDRKAGTLIGTKTFGKGTVQNIMETTDGGAIKITVAEYFTPNMKRVNQVGITPDIKIDTVYKEETDQVLEKAVEHLLQ